MPNQSGPTACSGPFDECGHVFHCPRCGTGSGHPSDAENNYCGACGFVSADEAKTGLPIPIPGGERAQEHDDLTRELGEALAAWQARRTTICEHTQLVSYGEAAEALMEVVGPRLAQLHDQYEQLRARLTPRLLQPSPTAGSSPSEPCVGSDNPRERCGLHHPTSLYGGGVLCCCDGPWLSSADACGGDDGRQERGTPVSLRTRLKAALAHSVADAAADVEAHTDAVMHLVDTEIDGWALELNDALNHNDETCEAVKARDAAEKTLAEVRRLQKMTIAASCRAHAIQQAEDTLAILDRKQPTGDRP
ncbi:hypothetical protein [Actinomadura geliboluensis]|uniref:hypothetical protein n=1 Tax=Actinomadura geliboluensis TaxID=882440 RepID=UPI0036A1D6D6